MGEGAPVMSQASAADAAKARGNEYFKKGKLQAAIDAYSEAIALNPDQSVYYSNRAFANYKINPEARAAVIEDDCRKCLALDPRSAKGNYYLGKVLTARGVFQDGLRHFQRAYDIQPPFKADVRRALWQCKKELWLAEQRDPQVDFVMGLAEAAVENFKQEQLQQCTDSAQREAVVKVSIQQRNLLRDKLASASVREDTTEVPQHLCCQISWSPLVDPVITPAGITYERQVLMDHLSRGSNFEPVTREPLNAAQCYPNKMLVDAVDAFVEEHPAIFFAAI